jgi:hypothetical protein
LPELLVGVAGLSLGLLAIGGHLFLRREAAPADLLDRLHTLLQLARLEAVSREVDCRLEVDRHARRLEVWDSRGTPDPGDDLLLYRSAVPAQAKLLWVGLDAEPQALPRFEIRFDPRGRVRGGAGEVRVLGLPRSGSVEVRESGELLLLAGAGA